MDSHNDIIDTLIKDIKCRKGDWYNEFNQLPRTTRYRIIKDIYFNYCESILEHIQTLDPSIHLTNIGTLTIKPSRKQYLDLINDGVFREEAIEIVKRDYRKLNGKT
jgi:hypothetical protein